MSWAELVDQIDADEVDISSCRHGLSGVDVLARVHANASKHERVVAAHLEQPRDAPGERLYGTIELWPRPPLEQCQARGVVEVWAKSQ